LPIDHKECHLIAADVTVKYQDQYGNSLADSETLSGNVGEKYNRKTKEISGWQVLETPANASCQGPQKNVGFGPLKM